MMHGSIKGPGPSLLQVKLAELQDLVEADFMETAQCHKGNYDQN